MERIYLLIADSNFLIQQKITQYEKEANIDPFNIVKIKADETQIDEILQEINTISFFGDSKMIIVEGVENLSRFSKEELDELLNYMKKPSSDVILIFTANEMPKNNELKQHLEKFSYIEIIKNLDNDTLIKFAQDEFLKEGYSIDIKAIENLIERTENDLYLLQQEINKLKTYSYESKKIGLEDVTKLVSRNLEDNIFDFSSSFLKGETKRYMLIYEDLLGLKLQTITIMNHLYQSINLIMQTQKLLSIGYNQESISNYLGISSGRAYHVIKEAKGQKTTRLEKIINDLSNLDLSIKTGEIEDKLGFELLLLGEIK